MWTTNMYGIKFLCDQNSTEKIVFHIYFSPKIKNENSIFIKEDRILKILFFLYGTTFINTQSDKMVNNVWNAKDVKIKFFFRNFGVWKTLQLECWIFWFGWGKYEFYNTLEFFVSKLWSKIESFDVKILMHFKSFMSKTMMISYGQHGSRISYI